MASNNLSFKDRLKSARRRAIIARFIIILAIIYQVMSVIKGVHFWTENAGNPIGQYLYSGTSWLINNSWFFPMSDLWQNIQHTPFETFDLVPFYKAIVPPLVVIVLCGFFVFDYITLKNKHSEAKHKIERESIEREVRKDEGIETISKSASIDVIITNETSDVQPWQDTWWGRISIGIAIVLIATAFGLK